MNDMKQAIAAMERAKEALAGGPAAAPEPVTPEPELDPITALRRWRLAAGVRFVGKSLHVKVRK